MRGLVLGLMEQRRSITADEAARLLNPLPAADQPIWAAALYAGLRRDELQALRCCDVDISGRLVQVEYVWNDGLIALKSDMRRRRVPLQARLLPYLDAHLQRTGRTGEDLLFGRTRRVPFVSSEIEQRAGECWDAAGLEKTSLDECRIAFALILIEAKATPRSMQILMGYPDTQAISAAYGHLRSTIAHPPQKA